MGGKETVYRLNGVNSEAGGKVRSSAGYCWVMIAAFDRSIERSIDGCGVCRRSTCLVMVPQPSLRTAHGGDTGKP